MFVWLCLLHFDPPLDWGDSLLSGKRSSSFHQCNPALHPSSVAPVLAFHLTGDPCKCSVLSSNSLF